MTTFEKPLNKASYYIRFIYLKPIQELKIDLNVSLPSSGRWSELYCLQNPMYISSSQAVKVNCDNNNENKTTLEIWLNKMWENN